MSNSRELRYQLGHLLEKFERDIHTEIRRHGPNPYGDWGKLADLTVESYRKVTLSRVRSSYRMLCNMCGLERGYYAFRKFLYTNQTLKQIDQLLKEHYSGQHDPT
ncbi:hypothetical protein YOLOSWAG_27 [Erwinia phage vB_EamM_Yoloswag]|uniref:Uncharacterized protein n=1 Tax=Erwinia phage vB_EamM_Yoloswag TaxID=1958956 RepID=A0A1S6L3Q2_9CAUD|nr:hypothetical protein HOR66_gp027 [Erwinia phage vB_EamM_Yoloswag]AQT28802.1 hypothetical protein YOLOSWAG_27 [Erwinia phage vB_EamM_Yoloswag]